MGRFVLWFFLMFCGGCASYRLGNSLSDIAHSIYIEPVRNSSLCPKASGPLTAQLIKKIQQNTALKVTKMRDAQLHLRVEIVDFSQKNSAYDSKDTSLVLSSDLCIVVECTLTHCDGRLLLESQRVEAHMDLHKQDSIPLCRDQVIPQLMERLAGKICTFIANIW
jgi:hypothetical protein